MGRITIVGSNKGGGSKSTTAVNLAVGLALRGQRAGLFDADKQFSCGNWHGFRQSFEVKPEIGLWIGYGDISQQLLAAAAEVDHLIVDVPGRNSIEFLTGGTVADIIISPSLVSQFDLDTLLTLEEQYAAMKEVNPSLELYMLHSRAETNPFVRPSERRDFMDFLADYPSLKPLETIIYQRTPYKSSIPLGLGAMELNPKVAAQAAEEMNNLLKEVYGL
ncbi:chromosome partitioning protein ParA [Salmonella enterica]|nr:chromosome partitioning protein ParA [Salmonella enterica]